MMVRARLSRAFIAGAIPALVVAVTAKVNGAEAKIWEEPFVLPTYRVQEPDSNPMFHKGDAYQGARKVIYPYPYLDTLTDVREDKSYKAVYLENEYVKLCFLPELGGRLFSAVDKTNGYDFFYRQHVIKPALIGMLGAWISGGIEWCVLHHHRATTFMPVDYTLAENPDGSKTLWFGEIERRHRAKWVIGATLYPDRSYIEVTVKIFNRTALPHSFLYWANVAVHANEKYQVIFPPSVNVATFHAKNDFAHWPIANEHYRGVDYSGVDLSWWPNHPEPVSFFAWDLKEDFSGGYDHGRQAGVIHVANHHVVVGAKLWEWSPGPRGRMWDKILTETDGPYAELMVGAYSDNQPDYSWIKPGEVKTFTQWWYPIRRIGLVKYANRNGAVNLELKEPGIAHIAVNTTTDRTGARVILRASGRDVLEQRADIAPDKPFVKDVTLPENTKQTDLELVLVSRDGTPLISYTPVERPQEPNLPDVVQRPPAPPDIKTVEELYLTARRIEQFHNPTLQPDPYYEEALRRDPNNSRVNIALGIGRNRRGLFAEAEQVLRRAAERISKNYTRPLSTEAYYQLGLALRAQGKQDEAYDNLYRATWDYAFHSAAYYQLAEISCQRGQFERALEQAEHSLSTNALCTRALCLKAAILRRLARTRQASETAAAAARIDPLNFWARNELHLAHSAGGFAEKARSTLAELRTVMRGDVQSHLELAVDYANCGLWDEAIDVLSRVASADGRRGARSPMIYYWLGHCWQKKGNPTKAELFHGVASRAPHDHCFPFRLESIDVLRGALERNPRDARAHYYLGCLLYDKQPENAITEWERSRDIDGGFALVHRNLGWGYYRAWNAVPKAIESYEKAVACNPDDPRFYYELDVLYEVAGTAPQKRLNLLEAHRRVVAKRDDSLSRLIELYVLAARYDDAIDILTSHHFHTWEGGGQIRGVYVDAFLLRGTQRLNEGNAERALADFQRAGEYPENLEVGRPKNDPRAPQVHYFLATAYEALGRHDDARESYTKAADQKGTSGSPQTRYYQALALAKIDRGEQAEQIYRWLIEWGQNRLSENETRDFFPKFGERQTKQARDAEARYVTGLGHLGLGDKDKAREQFDQAVRLNAGHLWAKVVLAKLR